MDTKPKANLMQGLINSLDELPYEPLKQAEMEETPSKYNDVKEQYEHLGQVEMKEELDKFEGMNAHFLAKVRILSERIMNNENEIQLLKEQVANTNLELKRTQQKGGL
ncbi:MAG TPA: hypothetical protein VHY08_00485 [Bacillota bacterium]|nr:hypothetical protein [Bacillota bacterium]